MLLTTIKDFSLANPLYAGATVSLYQTNAAFAITAVLATLYANPQGTGQPLANPQTLDQFGKFVQPVYIASPVIAVVNGLTFPTLTTGVIYTVPSFRIEQATSKMQYSYDGGVTWVDTGGWIFKNRGIWANATQYNLLDLVTSGGAVYICITAHLSVGAFDPAKFIVLFSLDQGTLPGGTAFQLRRGTTLQIDAITPVAGEAIEDTTKKSLVLGDGVLPGGYPLVSEMSFQKNSLISAVGAGTGDAITATIQSKLLALVNFMRVSILAPGANALAAPTFNLTLQTAGGGNTVTGAIAIVKGNNQAMIAGDIGGANHVLDLEYYAGKWRLLNPAGVAPVALDPAFLTSMIYPSRDGGWRDVYRAGWMPWGFNQQWGGAQVGHELVNGADGLLYKFDTATGYVEDNNFFQVANGAALTYQAQGFKVSENQSIAAVWVKIYKIGNPANNLVVRLLPDDGTGTRPTLNVPIANGTATAQIGKLHSVNPNGEWVRFVFPVSPALVAGTVYHLVLSSSGAVDAVNFWAWKCILTTKHYPHGNRSAGDATPTWTADATGAFIFMVENVTANAFMQAGGIFDQKIVFMEGTPLDQSKALVKPMREFFDGKSGSILIRGASWTKDKTIADFMYGLDHDRFVLRSNTATGFGQIDFYRGDGTKTTITAVAVDLSAGNHDIGITYRTVGDGADFIRLYVDGSLAAQATGQTFTMDGNFRELGTATIGGGFNVAPAFTVTYDMTVLPSAAGTPAAWTGTGVEANCYSVNAGKAFQNKGGYGNNDTGYYQKAAAAFSNANGWSVEWKSRVPQHTNTVDSYAAVVQQADGAKVMGVTMMEHFIDLYDATAVSYGKVQFDNRSVENVFLLSGKGSDFTLTVNGRLIFDGTGKMLTASANNQIQFGDFNAAAAENADVVWDYFKYYNTAIIQPQFSAGSLSEFAAWSGDKSGIFPTLYNGGAPISVKQYCGVERNYIAEPTAFKGCQFGLLQSPTTAAAGFLLQPDQELFAIGSDLNVIHTNTSSVNTTAGVSLGIFVDGVTRQAENSFAGSFTSNVVGAITTKRPFPLGLHKVEARWATSAGTLTGVSTERNLTVEAKS